MNLEEKTQSLAQKAIAEDKQLHTLLDSLEADVAIMSIYHPLAAYQRYCDSSKELLKARQEVENHAKLYSELGTTDHGGDVTNVMAMLGSLSLSLLHVGLLRQRISYIDSGLNTKAAFAFGMFSLYVAVLSMVLTVFFGMLPLLCRST